GIRRPRTRTPAIAWRDRRDHAASHGGPDGLLRAGPRHPADAEVVPLVHERVPRRRAAPGVSPPDREPSGHARAPRPPRPRRAVPARRPPPQPEQGRAPAGG